MISCRFDRRTRAGRAQARTVELISSITAGPAIASPAEQFRACIDRRVQPAVRGAVVNRRGGLQAPRLESPEALQLRQRRLGHAPHRLQPAVDDLDRLSRADRSHIPAGARHETRGRTRPCHWGRGAATGRSPRNSVPRSARPRGSGTSGRPRRPARARARRAPRPPSRRKAAHTRCQLPAASSESSLRTKSNEMSVSSMPRAHRVPGSWGTTTLGMPHSRAISVACSGPAPP